MKSFLTLPKRLHRAFNALTNAIQRYRSAENQRRRFNGIPRAYPDAEAAGVIDLNIRNLVVAMNIPGILQTTASCEGHSTWYGRISPYVAYRSTNAFACRFEKLLREDEQSTRRKLFYYWSNCGYINSDHELAFCLKAAGIGTWKYPHRRNRLNADFQSLASMVQKVCDQAKATSTVSEIDNKSQHTED
jgi:hypothetical protein